MPGRLYLCATPIGNLEDVTLRLLRILEEVDLVAAEDTRRTRKLLTRHGVSARMVSYHDANETQQTPRLVERLRRGEKVAVVSESGMPALSDPGFRILAACIQEQIPVEVIPGPSAVLTALVASGLPTARFAFEGFLPKKKTERSRRLREVVHDPRTLVFFESPVRIRRLVQEVLEILGERRVAVARELTKVHEEVIRGPCSEVLESLSEEVKGEVVLVVEGATGEQASLDVALEHARRLVAEVSTKSRAAAEAARRYGFKKRPIYEELTGL